MATTDFDYIQTRNEIINRALRIVGALVEGETASGPMLSQAADALNSLVKSWQTRHLFLWSLKVVTQSITSGDADYTLSLDPPVRGIDRAYIRDSNNYDTEIEVISFREYQDITDKAATGTPTHVAIDCQRTPTVYVWPVQTSTLSLRLLAVTRLADWDSASGTGDFASEYQQALTYGLAAELSHEYKLPLAERNLLRARANELFLDLKEADDDSDTEEFVASAYRVR